jgi:hypothetical protein
MTEPGGRRFEQIITGSLPYGGGSRTDDTQSGKDARADSTAPGSGGILVGTPCPSLSRWRRRARPSGSCCGGGGYAAQQHRSFPRRRSLPAHHRRRRRLHAVQRVMVHFLYSQE